MNQLTSAFNKLANIDVTTLVSKVKSAVLNYSDAQRMVEEATTDHPWGASSTLMQDISSNTHSFQSFHDTMDMIYLKLNERGASWRQCYKALQLIDYLIRNGSEKVIDSVRDHIYELKVLDSFRYVDDKGKDQGINSTLSASPLTPVRNRAEEIILLLSDPDKIKTEREKARENKGKYSGTSNGLSGGGFGNQLSSYNNQSGSTSYQADSYPSQRYYDSDLPLPKTEAPAKQEPKHVVVVAPVPIIDLMTMEADDDWGEFADAKPVQSIAPLRMSSGLSSINFSQQPQSAKPAQPPHQANISLSFNQAMLSSTPAVSKVSHVSSMQPSAFTTPSPFNINNSIIKPTSSSTSANYNPATFSAPSPSQQQRSMESDPFQGLASFSFPTKQATNSVNLMDS